MRLENTIYRYDVGPVMTNSSIRFVPINLERDAAICVQFRADSFICSFGNADIFYQSNGEDGARYIEWLRKIMSKNPMSAMHVWEGDCIIGQLELTIREDDLKREFGYVNLFYLIPEKRGTGIADNLNAYVQDYYQRLGISRLRLTVSSENARAIGYYVKHGWKDCGPRADFLGTRFMEKEL